ncbi:MAG: response regulator [Treponema sp.]|nr:response regulator [Treponema sp.]
MSKILIAFDSLTLRSLLHQKLESYGFEVQEAQDGLQALQILHDWDPDCILLYVNLPIIDAYAFCRIIKNNSELKDIRTIICTPEDANIYSFWTSNCNSDSYYSMSPDDTDGIIKEINKVLQKKKPKAQKIKKETFTTEEIVKQIIGAVDKELYELYVIRGAYYATRDGVNIYQLLDLMVEVLYSIYQFDAFGIIINDNKLLEVYRKSVSLSKKEFEEFKYIAHSDFQERINSRISYEWKNSQSIITDFGMPQKKEIRIKSYECFPLKDENKKEEDLICTIHIGSSKETAFNIRTRERIDFFCSVYITLIRKAIVSTRMKETENKIKKAFSRFLPPTLIDNIISEENSSIPQIGEKRQIAILIADIREFTAISEKNTPEAIVEFLNDYFTTMGQIIIKHGGTIDKFMGDSIMALFGAPESYIYNGNRAANAALEMIDALKTIDTSKLNMGNIKFNIGIGVHYGQPIAGSIGSQDKKEYTVIGDDVNLASRIEGLTKLYGVPIIISDSVKLDIDTLEKDKMNNEKPESEEDSIPHIIHHIDNVKVKGKSKSVRIYAITQDKENYPETFIENYSKGLNQYEIGNFSTAFEYFRKAEEICPSNIATKRLLERCTTYQTNKPDNWDGAVTLTTK